MSLIHELRVRAINGTMKAATNFSRCRTVELLGKYGATRVSELRDDVLVPFITEVEAMAIVQPTKLDVDFRLGDRVKDNSYPRRDGTVVGYEVRYLVQMDGLLHEPKYGHRAEKLQRVSTINVIKPPAIPVAPTYEAGAAHWSAEPFDFQVRNNY